jgi:splicing factor 3A subunit 2
VRRRLTPEKAAETALVVHNGRVLGREEYHRLQTEVSQQHHSGGFHPEVAVSLRLRLRGGTDRQNRVGSKFGGGGVSSGQNSERDRKERLRELALESVDLAKDPYLMRNHLGTYECKLCLTLHTNEGNYLAHTQGKKHQAGLAKRALMEAKLKPDTLPAPHTLAAAGASASTKHAARVKIGRPGYEISKSRDPETDQRCLSFDLHYPELDDEQQPRHRFMSAFEQRVETPPDRRYQYLLVACEPYETVAFKVPNEPIDRGEGRFVTNWDTEEKRFTLTLFYMNPEEEKS